MTSTQKNTFNIKHSREIYMNESSKRSQNIQQNSCKSKSQLKLSFPSSDNSNDENVINSKLQKLENLNKIHRSDPSVSFETEKNKDNKNIHGYGVILNSELNSKNKIIRNPKDIQDNTKNDQNDKNIQNHQNESSQRIKNEAFTKKESQISSTSSSNIPSNGSIHAPNSIEDVFRLQPHVKPFLHAQNIPPPKSFRLLEIIDESIQKKEEIPKPKEPIPKIKKNYRKMPKFYDEISTFKRENHIRINEK